MPKEAIATKSAPQAIGPYSQAIRAGGFLFISGQIPLDPATGELVSGDITRETTQVMSNLAAILSASGASWENIVRTTIYLTNLEHFAKVNAIYGQSFPQAPPARATVQVAALPRGAQVEIDAVVYLGG